MVVGLAEGLDVGTTVSGVEGLILYGMFADSGYCLSPLVAVLCLALKIGIINNTVLSAA